MQSRHNVVLLKIVSNIAFSLCALHASRAASELSPDISMSKSFFSNGQRADYNGMHAQSGLGPPMLRMHTGLKMPSGCDTRVRIGSQIAHMRISSAFAGTESPHPPPLHKRYVEPILHLNDYSNPFFPSCISAANTAHLQKLSPASFQPAPRSRRCLRWSTF